MKNIIITGINGQDGSYLAELLIKKKYKIYGIVRSKKSRDDFIKKKKNIKKLTLLLINYTNYPQ